MLQTRKICGIFWRRYESMDPILKKNVADLAKDRLQAALAEGRWSDQLPGTRALSEMLQVSVHTLRMDPRWDQIRTHPRFQELLRKYGS